jgi:hypothetical protein
MRCCLLLAALTALSEVVADQECKEWAFYKTMPKSESAVEEFTSDEEIMARVDLLADDEVLVLESYLSYCGVCAAWKPSIKAFSLAATNTTFQDELRAQGKNMPRVVVGAINCACESGDNCNYNGFPIFNWFEKGDRKAKKFEFQQELIFPLVRGKYDCLQASSMVWGTMHITEPKPEDKLFDKSSPFCTKSETKHETPPTRRWPSTAQGVWNFDDARISFLNVLMDMVRRLENSEGEALDKLTKDANTVLDVALKTLPFSGYDEKSLRSWQENLPNVNGATPALLGLALIPTENEYHTCSGEKQYTCALWQFFHLLCAHAGTDGHAPGEDGSRPYEVMEAIRIVVDDFFHCSECRRHFLDHYEKKDWGRQALIDNPDDMNNDALQLWLWRAHNDVTARTFIERYFFVILSF